MGKFVLVNTNTVTAVYVCHLQQALPPKHRLSYLLASKRCKYKEGFCWTESEPRGRESERDATYFSANFASYLKENSLQFPLRDRAVSFETKCVCGNTLYGAHMDKCGLKDDEFIPEYKYL